MKIPSAFWLKGLVPEGEGAANLMLWLKKRQAAGELPESMHYLINGVRNDAHMIDDMGEALSRWKAQRSEGGNISRSEFLQTLTDSPHLPKEGKRAAPGRDSHFAEALDPYGSGIKGLRDLKKQRKRDGSKITEFIENLRKGTSK